MYIFKTPEWIKEFDFQYNDIRNIPNEIYDQINSRLDKIIKAEPLVSIVIADWNEGIRVLKTIASLSKLQIDFPIEIIVINNNSTDNTQEILDKLHVKSYFQPIQGSGPARQMGQEKSLGKYILLADADCIYPPCWATNMINGLQQSGIICVYGRYSFMPDFINQRWKYFLLETMKDVIVELRQFKRPYLNTYGISMGYLKEYGLAVGCTMQNVRGSDGRLSFDLMQFGKIKQIRSNENRVWTNPRTIHNDGSVGEAILKRVGKECRRFFSMFTPHPPHNTKLLSNG